MEAFWPGSVLLYRMLLLQFSFTLTPAFCTWLTLGCDVMYAWEVIDMTNHLRKGCANCINKWSISGADCSVVSQLKKSKFTLIDNLQIDTICVFVK